MERLQRVPVDEPSVLLIGHNPALKQLISELSAGGCAAAFRQDKPKFPTCAFATIEFKFDDWALLFSKSGHLVRITIPADLN